MDRRTASFPSILMLSRITEKHIPCKGSLVAAVRFYPSRGNALSEIESHAAELSDDRMQL